MVLIQFPVHILKLAARSLLLLLHPRYMPLSSLDTGGSRAVFLCLLHKPAAMIKHAFME